MNRSTFVLIIFTCVMSIFAVKGVSAQTGLMAAPSGTSEQIVVPKDLTRDEVRDLLSKLSDQQVRDLLLQRLDAVAEENEQEDQVSLRSLIAQTTLNVGVSVFGSAKALPSLFTDGAAGWNAIVSKIGLGGVFGFIFRLFIAIAIGLAGFVAMNYLTLWIRQRWFIANPDTLFKTIQVLSGRLVLDLLKVVAFVVASMAATRIVYDTSAQQLLSFNLIAFLVVVTLLMATVARFNLAPYEPQLRLMSMDDQNAKRMFWYTVMGGFTIGVFAFTMQAQKFFNIDYATYRIGFWLNTLLHIFFAIAIYKCRNGLSQALIGSDSLIGPFGIRVAFAWPWIAIVLTALSWFLVEAIAGAGRFDLLDNGENYWTLLLIAFVPVFDAGLRGLVRHLTPPPIGEGLIAERAHVATLASYVRAGRVIMVGFILMLLADIWDFNLFDTASEEAGTRIISQILDGFLFFLIGYLAWEIVGLMINRRLAKEHGDSGVDMESEEPGGGEGGGAGLSRLATILPIFKLALQVAIIVMTILLGLGRLGVDITPLLAGAGIVGLAIGFGAQTLVRDIVSGVFFLADDAFRVGEYLVIGTTVGTVEKISIRSLQLRHHQGPVHTIPYGEIPQVTNNSRDWVIMKMKFTFPFDTDANRIKKLFKRIGAEMMDADYSGDLIQTFKSQGVYDVDDVGIVIRGKFMAKPGTQWVIRKDIYNRVQKALDEAGIQFARKEVRVQIPGMEGTAPLTEDQKQVVGAAVAEAADNKGLEKKG